MEGEKAPKLQFVLISASWLAATPVKILLCQLHDIMMERVGRACLSEKVPSLNQSAFRDLPLPRPHF